ncbi:hypothetical protein PPYR_15121 [Photinus pyralis]|uniref:HMG box domain-containing protein n=1 Tax=Photinus pyralis TaxID=7054 RepID=A0A5N3ZZJ3_PHOPY|nr:hypothetical protein PPYR_15121 [Photinus pyralis]
MENQQISTSAFLNYLAQYRRENPNKSAKDIARDGGAMWRGMTEEERQPFKDMADRARRLQRTKVKRSKRRKTLRRKSKRNSRKKRV